MNLGDLQLIELDNSELESTEFYSAYSSLIFNGGIIFKRVGSQPEFLLGELIEAIDKEILEVVIENTSDLIPMGANGQIHDFIFDLLTHNDIAKKWRYNDDDYFTELSPKFDSKERFRKIGLDEINVQDFTHRLSNLAREGSVYDSMNGYSTSMIDTFRKTLLAGNDRIIIATYPWGEYQIGWFKCFFIIRKTDIVILGVDDYD